MVLIADSGATTIDWALVNDNGNVAFTTSKGINFSLIPFSQYESTLRENVPTRFTELSIEKIWFYAAGCRTDEQKEAIKTSLKSLFRQSDVAVDNDLLAAARAICGNSEGIACILGTGSNACRYSPDDGGRIVASVSPLGFILGDEGSGTFIGKRIISDALKNLFPSKLTDRFFEFAQAGKDEILSHIYSQQDANTYIARFAKFASLNLKQPEIQNIVYQSFDIFIKRNVLQLLQTKNLPVGFVGSVAHSFHPILRKVVEDHRLELSVVLPSPIEALVNYHINYLK